MKKYAVIAVIVAVGSIGGVNITNAQETPSQSPQLNTKIPGSMIDDINVPFDVLDYAQTKYQGYAVTKVSKFNRDSKEAYRLQVSRDTNSNIQDSIYLIYGTDWKLIVKEDAPKAQLVRQTHAVPERPKPLEDKPSEERQENSEQVVKPQEQTAPKPEQPRDTKPPENSTSQPDSEN